MRKATLAKERSSRRRAERLAAAMFETLLRAIDANDPLTGAHVRRVARYASILAEAADLSGREIHVVERVALFHDIGKIDQALFDIIHEEARLTADERRAIATHPARGADVLAPLAAFYPELRSGVLFHHERWDGRGYPRGLHGKSIPLPARIVTLADTFDAITFTRRYSRARSLAVAQRVIANGRGAQFDPALVDLFLFPPVLASIVAAFRATRDRRPEWGGRDRRSAPAPTAIARPPDVMFRWRDPMRL